MKIENQQDNLLESSKKEVIDRGGNFNKSSNDIAMERAELMDENAKSKEADAKAIAELNKKYNMHYSPAIAEKLAEADEIKAKKAVILSSVEDNNPDLTTAEGRQAEINATESDYEKAVKEIDSNPETLEERNQKVINESESDYEKVVREVDSIPETLEEKNQKIIDATESDYEKTVREIDSQPKTQAEKNNEEIAKFFGKEETTAVKNYDNDGNEIIEAEKPQTMAEKNQEEMKKYFGEDESTMIKNYDKDGNEIVEAEKPQTLEEKNQEVIKSTESDYEKVVREVDTKSEVKTEIPSESPQESGKKWDAVQSEALGDLVKGLKEKKPSKEAIRIDEIMSGKKAEGAEKKESPMKARLKKSWGWVKERLKGLVTFGYAEVRQAERFRSGTKEEAKVLQEEMKGMDANTKRTENLSEAEAYEEAARMQEMAKEESKKWESMSISKEDLEKYSEMVTQEKIESNNAFIESIVVGSTGRLLKRLEKYKNEFGESVLTPEKIAAFQDALRDKLQVMQKAVIEKKPYAAAYAGNAELIKKNIRDSFDPNYWRRYVYGGVELTLMAVAAKYAVAKMTAGAVMPGQPAPFPSGMENIPMDQNVWTTSKQLMAKNFGINNMSNSEVMKLAKAICGDNGVGVNIWDMKGSIPDTGMMQGHALKIGKGAKAAIEAILHARGI